MTRVMIVGAKGRMGQILVHLAQPEAGFKLAAAIDEGDRPEEKISECDAVIDFSHHTATAGISELAAKHKKALVIGTTGHNDAEKKSILKLQDKISIVYAANFSVGVNVLFYLTRKAAEILGPDYDQEIFEMHHRLKLDAPSGTAVRLGEILAEVKKSPYETIVRHGRKGETGKRTGPEIGMHAFRGGDVVGEHTVYFAGTGERIELTHRASSRETFAAGALRAAAWACQQSPGLYSMQDVLGLKD
jgi:4-hydroxy-tetrahydrodipicolinate reductase